MKTFYIIILLITLLILNGCFFFSENENINNPPTTPSNPVPSNKQTGVSPYYPKLSWSSSDTDGDFVYFDIYFGTSSNPPLVERNTMNEYYYPGKLKLGTKYYWKIVAKDSKGAKTSSPVWSFTTNYPPDIPSNPSPSNGQTNVSLTPTLSWLSSSSDPDGDTVCFDIYFGTYLGTYSNPPLVKSNTTSKSYYPGTLKPGTNYYWKIVAKDSKGEKTSSPVWSFQTKYSQYPPYSPSPSNGQTGVSLTPTLSWLFNSSDPDVETVYFDIYFGTSSNPPLVKSNTTSKSYNPGTLKSGTKYYWKIVAKDSNGESISGPVWYFTTINHPPTTPSYPYPFPSQIDVSLTPTLSWSSSDPDGDTVYFDIYFGTSFDPPLVKSNTTSKSYYPGTLKSKTKYFWKIVAKDSNGESTSGDLWYFTTKSTNNPPDAPSNPSPYDGQTDVSLTPTLSWTCSDPDGDTVYFDIYFGIANSINPPPLVMSNTTSKSYNPGTLKPGTKYYWMIVARDSESESETGHRIWYFTTKSTNNPPNVPSNPNPASGQTGVSLTPTLSWASSDPDGDTLTFDVYFGTSSNPPLVKSNTTSKSYYPGTLKSKTKYFWKIVARDSKGAETSGPVWYFTTKSTNNPPNVPSYLNPHYGETGVTLTPRLLWSCSDPDGDTLTFDVYFGTSSNPPLVKSNVLGDFYYPETLKTGTKYYWKIVAKDGKGASTSGPIWYFTTCLPPTTPSDPSPYNGETGVSLTPRLSWSSSSLDESTVFFDIYFGTNPDNLPLVKSNTMNKYYYPGTLKSGTKYYWKIVAKVTLEVKTTGPIWYFTTNNPPSTPSNPSPYNGETGVSLTPTLSWSSSDPDGDTLIFDIYFGTSSNPPLVKSNTTSKSYNPGTLKSGTKYYWKIVARDSNGASTSSPVWYFTTNHPPTTPSNPSPYNGQIVSVYTTLSWSCSDPDGDTVYFDVYIGKEDPTNLKLVESNTTSKSYIPGPEILDFGTTFYWKIVAKDSKGATTEGPIWYFKIDNYW